MPELPFVPKGQDFGIWNTVADSGEAAGPGFELLRGKGLRRALWPRLLLGDPSVSTWQRKRGGDDGHGDGELEQHGAILLGFLLILVI